MEKKNLTRKDFLANTSKYAVGAVVGVTGLNALSGGKLLASPNATWPLPYTTLTPDEAREKAHYLYWNDKDCCSGVFGAFTELLKEKIGDPWTYIPMEIMLFGRGGGVGWGSLCGAVNGGAAIISSVVDKGPSGNLITELWGWYCSEELPSVEANAFNYSTKKYEGDLPRNIAGSPLCHTSVSQWCMIAQKKVSDVERKERCARIAGDIAAKTVELLNAHFAGTFALTYVDPATVAACQTCHGGAAFNNVMTKMDCEPCHGDPHSTTAAEPLPGAVSTYKLQQNYPNPFNPSTKIEFAIPSEEKVDVTIFNIQGKEIAKLVDHESYNAGRYSLNWDGKDNFGNKVSSGVYLARLKAGSFMQTIKMNLVK